MYLLGLALFVVHIVAFIAGGANSVVMPLLGRRMPTATPEVRDAYFEFATALSKVGKYAMITLLVTGVLVLWLKWNFQIPNVWFWVKMAGIVAMLVFISLNEMTAKRIRAGEAGAARRAAMFGALTGVSFLAVIISAVLAFN